VIAYDPYNLRWVCAVLCVCVVCIWWTDFGLCVEKDFCSWQNVYRWWNFHYTVDSTVCKF
jgi:hypothetical protein